MRNFSKFLSAACAAVVSFAAVAGEDGLTEAQEAVAKAGPKKLRLMVAGFGTIESMVQVDKWLGEQLQPQRNLDKIPTLDQGEKIQVGEIHNYIIRANWNTRKMEYIEDANEIRSQNERDRMMLSALRTKALTDSSQRYTPLAKDYLQASLSEKCSLIQVVDRSNADMNLVEQSLNGDDSSALAGATCILTAAMGDREEDSRTVTVNGKGTKVKISTYTQPYVGKVRDLQGNVLFAFKGTSEWSSKENSVVKSEISDPARKLVEKACDEIAEKLADFFTCKLSFKIKAPAGVDADDATVKIDGKTVDADDAVRVLKIEHALVATLDGCQTIRRIVELDGDDGEKTVKLVFKKQEAAGEED
ncbi:MAG: hypothetical protein ILO34_08300 [Kiritimatiellae bacterium]|nr:hypothetical protein [Kiritimatiellia bacterium]